jgi:hypothetical protein
MLTSLLTCHSTRLSQQNRRPRQRWLGIRMVRIMTGGQLRTSMSDLAGDPEMSLVGVRAPQYAVPACGLLRKRLRSGRAVSSLRIERHLPSLSGRWRLPQRVQRVF